MSMRSHHDEPGPDRSTRLRHRHGGEERRHPAASITVDGFPGYMPDSPKLSPVVAVTDESRARYPWLPSCVIAGSIWSGPRHERVQVDEDGGAAAWPRGARQGAPATAHGEGIVPSTTWFTRRARR
jgi:hypothetical protein